MVGHGTAGGRRVHRLQVALLDQLVQQLGVVDDLVVTAHLWVLIAQGVEAVSTGDHDLALLRRNALEGVVQGLDVLLSQHLEEELVTGAAGGVTRAALVLTQDGEFHTSGVQQLRDRAGRLGGVVVVDACATDPEQVLGVVEVLDVLAEDRYLDAVGLRLLDPVGALVVVLAPRVALGLHVLEQATQLGRELGLSQHLVAAHVDDVVDVLDIHRALLDTGATVGAGPQDVWVDNTHLALGDQLQQRHVGVRLGCRICLGGIAGEQAATGRGGGLLQQVRGRRDRVVTQVHDELLRAQRLLRVPRWALLLAAATLGTGGEVHPALPGEVLDGAGADVIRVRVGVFHGQDAPLGGHRLRFAERVTAVGVALQEDVEERHEAVPCDTPGDVLTHDEQPDHAGEQLDQREDGDHHRGLRQDLRDLHRQEVGGDVATLVAGEGGDLAGLHEHHAQALKQDHDLDEVRGLGVGAVEAGLALLIADALSDDDQGDDAQRGADTQDLVNEVVDGPVADDRPAALGVEGLDVGLEPDQ